MKIFSRTDANQVWYGTVTLVDYESASQGNSNDMYYGNAVDPMSASSKYPFYVELDSSEDMLLGQHVYLELDTGDGESEYLTVSSAFICYDDDGSTYVWAEKNGKLEKRTVTLGEYNFMMDTMEVLEGLTEEDYIAFPDGELCIPGAPTTHDQPVTDDAVIEGAVVEGGVA